MDFTNDTNKVIYLAGPYSHKNETIKHIRYLTLTYVSAFLETRGVTNFSPITHSVPQASVGSLDGTWDTWEKTDKLMIKRACDEVWVVMIEGWEESRGVSAEIAFAKSINKPVRYFRLSMVTEELIEVKDIYAKIE